MSIDAVGMIAAKRDGQSHSAEEIGAWISAYVAGEVSEEQMAAWAMAVYLRGMDESETAALTEAMWHSGVTLHWPESVRPCADKHSTGGVGDKISLVLAPLLACLDVRVPMLSGRGLGATGGTLDKLESIPGFRADLDVAQLQSVVRECGCVITGTTREIAPADKKLYALRDVTATVASIPLITASIMSKKLAEGLDALVLDVKWGSGAFMKTVEAARALAESLVSAGRRVGVATRALITDMNQPLGQMVGNSVEVDEALEVLEGRGPADVRELTIRLAVDALIGAGRTADPASLRRQLEGALESGEARERFAEMVRLQGGDLDAPRPVAERHELLVGRGGYVERVDAERLGRALVLMGGGRQKVGESIDHSVGLQYLVRIGDRVEPGTPWLAVFAPASRLAGVRRLLDNAIEIGDDPVTPPELILDRIE